MILPYKIEVEYGEIYVIPEDVSPPCHDWIEDYIAQGFCWLETQVAFLTLQEKGLCEVTVEIADEIKIRPDAIRAIQVPFGLDEDSDVVVSASSFKPTCAIPKGEYCLIFQTGLKHQNRLRHEWNEMWCSFTFIRRENEVQAKILRKDKHLTAQGNRMRIKCVELCVMEQWRRHFEAVPDPRKAGHAFTYQLCDVLMLALCALLCGAETFVEMEEFGQAKQEWLCERLGLGFAQDVPSHDTIGRLFSLLVACFLFLTRTLLARALKRGHRNCTSKHKDRCWP